MWLIDAVEGATTKVVEERKILSVCVCMVLVIVGDLLYRTWSSCFFSELWLGDLQT